jgi:hypothetical protein
MAVVICDVRDYKHRSKRKLKSYTRQNGLPCYGCTLKAVVIREVFDPDGDIEAVAGKDNTVVCSHYEYDEK